MNDWNLDLIAAQKAQEVLTSLQKEDEDKLKQMTEDNDERRNSSKSLRKKIKEEAESVENDTNKAFGVLVENGPYAFFLWLESTKPKKNEQRILRESIIEKAKDLLKKCSLLSRDNNNSEQSYQEIAEEIAPDLHKLILAKSILERYMTYLRYNAKAKAKEYGGEVS